MGFLEVCLAMSIGHNETFNENCTNTERSPLFFISVMFKKIESDTSL
jgi:hypothetical protein